MTFNVGVIGMNHVEECEVPCLRPVGDEGDGHVLLLQYDMVSRQSDGVPIFSPLLGHTFNHFPDKLISVQMYHNCT